MSNILKVVKSIGVLPTVLNPNGVYFVKEADGTYAYVVDNVGSTATKLSANSIKPNETQVVACSGEKALLALETAVVTFRVIGARTLSALRASLSEAPTGSNVILDIKKNGVSVLSTKLVIDATMKTSVGSTTTPVITTPLFADDSEVSIDITQIGAGNAGKGLKVYLSWAGL